jgi:hypothetical protein
MDTGMNGAVVQRVIQGEPDGPSTHRGPLGQSICPKIAFFC